MSSEKLILLSTAYLPNIQYISKFFLNRNIVIEVFDTYQKQSYRNRTTILGANGPLDLVIPVKRPKGSRTKTCEVLLDYDMNWQTNHWRAINAAYNHSPFFEIFKDELKPLYRKKTRFLIDWNQMLLEKIFAMTGRNVSFDLSTSFISDIENTLDYRDSIHPKRRMKKPDPLFKIRPYFQVFNDKHKFVSHLSFIDLLFNEGPQAISICREYISTF